MDRFLIFILSGILLLGCTAVSSNAPGELTYDPDAVLEKKWAWESTVTPVESIAVDKPENYTILFKSDGNIQVRFDCNNGRGTYEISPGKLSFGPMLSTKMACPPGSHDFRFAKDLQHVISFFLKDGSLYLELPMDSGTMKFRQMAVD